MPLLRCLAFSTLALLCCFTLSGCDSVARWAYDTAISAEQGRADLAEHTVSSADGIDWHLLRSENAADKPVVLLVHGFGADSNNWLRFVNELEDDFHFIVPDLPGHGLSSRTTAMDYRIGSQASRLLELMSALNIDQFHMVGSSMGGAITLATTLQAPTRVLSMGLMDAAGITLMTPEFAALANSGSGNNPLVARQADDMFSLMEWAMAKPPYVPDFMIRQLGARKTVDAAILDKVWQDINGSPSLQPYLPSMNTPTLIQWGAKDRLLGLDNAAIFDASLPNSELAIFDDIGHLPMMEAPERSADGYRTFWQNVAAQ